MISELRQMVESRLDTVSAAAVTAGATVVFAGTEHSRHEAALPLVRWEINHVGSSATLGTIKSRRHFIFVQGQIVVRRGTGTQKAYDIAAAIIPALRDVDYVSGNNRLFTLNGEPRLSTLAPTADGDMVMLVGQDMIFEFNS